MHEHDWSARAEDATTEDGLFRLALELEADDTIDARERAVLLERVGARIDALRLARGLAAEPTIEELLDRWDGPAPADPHAVGGAHPGAEVKAGTYVEYVIGRMRVIPIASVEPEDGITFTMFPSRPRARRVSAGRRPLSPTKTVKSLRQVELILMGLPAAEFDNGPLSGLDQGTPEWLEAVAALEAQIALDASVDDDEAPPLSPAYRAWLEGRGFELDGPFAEEAR